MPLSKYRIGLGRYPILKEWDQGQEKLMGLDVSKSLKGTLLGICSLLFQIKGLLYIYLGAEINTCKKWPVSLILHQL